MESDFPLQNRPSVVNIAMIYIL